MFRDMNYILNISHEIKVENQQQVFEPFIMECLYDNASYNFI